MSNPLRDSSMLPDVHVSNDIIDNPAERARAWERDGYWFFRNVLDLEAIAEFRRPVLEELKRIGVVDADSTEPVWNGRNMENFPAPTHAGYEPFPALVRNRRWRDFLDSPRVAALFEHVLGSKAHWVPVAELRITPPGEGVDGDLFVYPHQDGFYNEGYRCLTAWMPFWPVARATGGLAVAEGMHRGEYLHDTNNPPRFTIPPSAIPDGVWRTADYVPGDVVLFDRKLPHSGLRNRSQRNFRVSFDVRCILPGDPAPVVGHVVSAGVDHVLVREADGRELRLPLTDASYCRGLGRNAGMRIERTAVPAIYLPGQEVMITIENGAIRLLREPKY
jgi:hypothetical protein